VAVSVVIAAYTFDRFETVLRTIDSVLAQVPIEPEVVVVVDHNSDLARALKARLDVRVRLLENDGPVRGLSPSRNIGVLASTGEVVAFIDDDATAESGWLAALCAPFDDSRVQAVGGRIVPSFPAVRPAWLAEEFDWLVGCTYRGMPLGPAGETRNVIGCNMAFRRAAFTRVGLFRSDLGRVGHATGQAEETELCIRLLATMQDARIVHRADAVVRHLVPPGRLTLAFAARRAYMEGLYKARMARSAARPSTALSTETQYLRHLLQVFLPGCMARGLEAGRLAQAAFGVFCIGAVAIGSLVGRFERTESIRKTESAA
jgi:glycosyltransferase involved in cell wall biosynthesis